MKRKERKKQYKAGSLICFIGVFLLVLTGCKDKVDENGSMTSDDGRSYGGVIEANQGEKVSTAFFDMTVEEADKYDTYQFEDGLYQADSGNTYLVLKLTIKNTYEKDLPMSISDFVLDFEGNDSKKLVIGYGNTDLKDAEFMDNIFTLKQGESVTKYILFTVADKEEYSLGYTEYYEDELEGNQFKIAIKPEKKEPVTTETSEKAAASGDTEDGNPENTQAEPSKNHEEGNSEENGQTEQE